MLLYLVLCRRRSRKKCPFHPDRDRDRTQSLISSQIAYNRVCLYSWTSTCRSSRTVALNFCFPFWLNHFISGCYSFSFQLQEHRLCETKRAGSRPKRDEDDEWKDSQSNIESSQLEYESKWKKAPFYCTPRTYHRIAIHSKGSNWMAHTHTHTHYSSSFSSELSREPSSWMGRRCIILRLSSISFWLLRHLARLFLNQTYIRLKAKGNMYD